MSHKFGLDLDCWDSEYFNTYPFVHDEWMLLLDKLIFKSLVRMDKLKIWEKYHYLFTIAILFLSGEVKFGVIILDGQVGVYS